MRLSEDVVVYFKVKGMTDEAGLPYPSFINYTH